MAYESIDVLQNALAKNVFHYAQDAKKAAGRALGTLVEIINFYLLKTWGYEQQTAIERRIPEYANPDLTHNVEFTLHPAETLTVIELAESALPFTSKKIMRALGPSFRDPHYVKNSELLSTSRLLRNSCTIYETTEELILAYLGDRVEGKRRVILKRLHPHPFAMFECKRVGVEEGARKGPQTIEKAKQGAYVARTVSSLQKIRRKDGSQYGVLETDDSLQARPYDTFMREIVASTQKSLLENFILTIGIVSNHGNWFTSDDHNKELKVLAQSYDWLLFLSDSGLARFIEDLILNPAAQYFSARDAFTKSYHGGKKSNNFTKVRMQLAADEALQAYFKTHITEIEKWFTVISPQNVSIASLKNDIRSLKDKNWKEITT